MKKAIIYSLAVMVAAAGLLLGGNVRAEAVQATQVQAISNQEASVRIEEIRAKIAELTAEIKKNQSQTVPAQDASARIEEIRAKIAELTAEIKKNQGQPVIAVSKPALTQAQLDQIETRVGQISAEIDRIKKEVAILVRIRAISQKIAAIRLQIAALKTGKTIAMAPITASQPATPQEKEARIAQIKQQIGELSQEMNVQKKLEDQNKAAATTTEKCQGDSCGIAAATSSDSGQSKIEISTKTTESGESQKKGFWESMGDFFRKVFTF